jgi:adenylosuccinate lyase
MHEEIRTLSMQAGAVVKQEGKDNNLLELIAADQKFDLTLEELQARMNPINYVGRSVQQVEEFLSEVIDPVLEEHKELLGMTAAINV